MMNEHLELESLSAYLDGELDRRERSLVEQHLQSCAGCAATRAKLAGAAGSVASLGPVTVTADEHRVLRQAVLRSRPAGAGKRFWGFPNWAFAAGGLVVVAVTALGLTFLRGGGPTRSYDALTEAAAPTAGGSGFNFASGSQVDRAVAELPEVAAGLNRYPADDARSRRDEAVNSLKAADSGAGATAESSTAESAPQQAPAPAMAPADRGTAAGGEDAAAGNLRADQDGSSFTNEAADACLSRVAATQTYPMVPLLAREASYQGRPAWLLVYAWSPDAAGQERLDRWQSWLVDPADCRNLSGAVLEAAALYRGYSPAS